MLHELRIENLLLIERAELRFDPGLNVITGETGAGKTVLAQSLGLVLGEKPRSGIIRPGADEAWVEATFDLPRSPGDLGPEVEAILERLPRDSESVTLSRRVSESGRSSGYIGGRGAPAADLSTLGRALLSFHGQHRSRSLTSRAAQLRFLDDSGGTTLSDALSAYRSAHGEVRRVEAELEEHRRRTADGGRHLDLIRFELDEIEALEPDPEEHQSLSEERSKLRSLEVIRESAATALGLLDGDDIDQPGAAQSAVRAGEVLGARADRDPELSALARRVESASIELQDAAGDLRSYAEGLEDDPERAAFVESRLDEYDRLQRKHDTDAAGLLARIDSMRESVEQLEAGTEREEELVAELERLRTERERAGTALSAERHRTAEALSSAVTSELSSLAMHGASFKVTVSSREEWTERGRDEVAFMLATNAGMAPGPVAETASGGELSRVMLALIKAGGGVEGRVTAFDEIDAGLGGTTANSVGESLKEIAAREQVITITHLPQVASLASAHFRVERVEGSDPALATVERLQGDAVVEEVTRMLGAEDGDRAAVEHARELVESGASE